MKRRRGISRPDFAILAALAGLGAYGLNEFQADMELAQVQIVVRNMRSGLQAAIGERLMRGEDRHLAELLAANPLKFLGQLPENYVGESALPGGTGNWRFDPATGLLEYRPRHPGAFEGRRELHWRLRAIGDVADRPVGLRLEAA